MHLDVIETALSARKELRAILEGAERAKFSLFNSDMDDTVFQRTYQMINNIIRDSKIAIENINTEYQKACFEMGVFNEQQFVSCS